MGGGKGEGKGKGAVSVNRDTPVPSSGHRWREVMEASRATAERWRDVSVEERRRRNQKTLDVGSNPDNLVPDAAMEDGRLVGGSTNLLAQD